MKRLITWMWRDVPYDNVYTYQSDDPDVIRRMKQRKDFWQNGEPIEWEFVVFKTRKKTPQSARRTLSRITRGIVKKNVLNDVRYAESNTIVGTNNKHKTKKGGK